MGSLRFLVFIFCAIIMITVAGCGVSKEIHNAVLQDFELEKEKLRTALSEKKTLEKEVEGLKDRLDELQFALAGRNTELEAVRQQNLELMNIRNNQAAEIEELHARTGHLTEAKNKEIEKLRGTYDHLVGELQEEIKKGEIKVTQVLDRLSVNMVERILFDSGSANLKPEGLKVLERMGSILKEVTDKQIRVEGHTDNVPIGGRLVEKFPTNWELSVARAATVVKFLSEKTGVNPNLLSADGYSMYRPIASNDTREGRSQNRRIEIVLVPLSLDRVIEDLR